MALLAYEASTRGLHQSGVTDMLAAVLVVLPIAVVCFFVLDVAGCFVAWVREKSGSHRREFGLALAEALVTPVLTYLEILAAFWLRSR